MQRDAQKAECQVKMTALNDLPYPHLI